MSPKGSGVANFIVDYCISPEGLKQILGKYSAMSPIGCWLTKNCKTSCWQFIDLMIPVISVHKQGDYLDGEKSKDEQFDRQQNNRVNDPETGRFSP